MVAVARIPHRATVRRIIGEEARNHAISTDDVIGNCRRPLAMRARQNAVARILKETGCSARALAMVWGMSCRGMDAIVRRGAPEQPWSEVYDPITKARLFWAYGEARADQIIAGLDPNTNQDIASWRRLCALGGAA